MIVLDEHCGNEQTLVNGVIAGAAMGYVKGFDDGEKVGYVKGTGDAISLFGTYASAKLREGDGSFMAGYRLFKSRFDKFTEEK